ncbi:MAG: VanZ family protein [Planctomycetaceae bacterium]|nr:VanZ family protein [Planctomycetaceae bacterium]
MIQSTKLHALLSVGMLLLVSWALLSPDPFEVVRNTPLAPVERLSDLVLHTGVFLLLSIAVIGLGYRIQQRLTTTAAGLLAVYSGSTELIQARIPGRTCDPVDAMANLTGILIAYIVVRTVIGVLRERQPSIVRN